MSLFKVGKKQQLYYKVLKCYKIVDIDIARKIAIHDLIKYCNEFLYQTVSKYPDVYEINFGQKQWKSKKGFQNAITKVKGQEIFDFTGFYNESKSSVYIDNNILNIQSSIPDKSMVSLELAIPSLTIDNNKLVLFFKNLFEYLEFEYGYIIELTENYDFGTERKVKKRLFGYETTIEEIDTIWRFHSIGINHGFVKNIYPVNILNKSQIAQPTIRKYLNDKIGVFEQINDQLSLWFLNKNQLEKVKRSIEKTKYVIANRESSKYFLESGEAKRFYNEMKLA